jgi:hypothetical protein
MDTTLSGQCDVYGTNNECKEKCSNITVLGECESDIRKNECFWLYNNNNVNIDTGACRSKTDETIECTFVKRSDQCKNTSQSNFGGRCKWVEEEGSKCQPTRTGCEGIETSHICNTPGIVESKSCYWIFTDENNEAHNQCHEVKHTCTDISTSLECNTYEITTPNRCLWISTEVDYYKCQEIHSECSDLTKREGVCTFPGIAKTWDETNNKWTNIKDCYFIKASNDGNTPADCIDLVCYYYYYCYCYYYLFY